MKFLGAARLLISALLLGLAISLPAAPAAATKKLSFWKVEGKTNAIHLLGSIHFLKRSFYPLPEPIETVFEQADTAVFEVDFEDARSPLQILKLQQAGFYEKGDSLRKHVSQKTYNELKEYLKRSGSKGDEMDQFKAWMVAVMVTGMEIQKLGYAAQDGVDQHFFARAKKEKKKIAGLETLEFQLSLFQGLTPEEEDAMLMDALQESSRFGGIVQEMVSSWERGDGPALDKLVSGEMRRFPKLYKKLLVDRNQAWIGPLEKLIKEGRNAFVVVGAAHLVGEDSVVEMLKKKGYRVTQLERTRKEGATQPGKPETEKLTTK